MKKYIIISILILLSITTIVCYSKYKATQKELLTKNVIFDIIEDVEGIVISCITKSGNKSMSEQDKLDFAVRYIIENRQNFSSDIIKKESTYYNKEENINFGKVDVKFFNRILNKFFTCSDYTITDYKHYKNGFIELDFEPIENTSFDRKEYIDVQVEQDKYIINAKYTRTLNELKNEFYVQYIFNVDENIKISEVTIYNSIMN
ncbi:MAG: hypothetical protein J6A15_06790 [Clostridia bacterium]|nr:hypothetical protein [Clostridia bacterium]